MWTSGSRLCADRNTRLVSVEREAKSGDTAVIDFEGFKDGVPFEGGKGENYQPGAGLRHALCPALRSRSSA